MSKAKQQELAAAPNKLEPTDYGLPATELYKALPLENRADPEAETGRKLTGKSPEFLLKHYPHLIAQPGPRTRTITTKNCLDINTGRAQPITKKDDAA
jgi:hypothetical protein